MKTKNIFAGIGIAAILLTVSIPAFAQQQSSATAQANAQVISPVEILPISDLNFGNMAVGTLGGTVKIQVSTGTAVRSSTSSVTLPSTTGTVSAGSFTVKGEPNYQYAITISPTSVTLDNTTTTGSTMTAASFETYPPVSTGGTLSAAGTQTLLLGGVLTAGPNQPKGVYSSTTSVTVTVSYQ